MEKKEICSPFPIPKIFIPCLCALASYSISTAAITPPPACCFIIQHHQFITIMVNRSRERVFIEIEAVPYFSSINPISVRFIRFNPFLKIKGTLIYNSFSKYKNITGHVSVFIFFLYLLLPLIISYYRIVAALHKKKSTRIIIMFLKKFLENKVRLCRAVEIVS